MKIESMALRNFKPFRDMVISDLPRFCVFVGANGTGKSTLFSMFGFLRDAMTGNVNTALAKLGGAAAASMRSAAARPKAPSKWS